jgi:transcriptional regulator GlxA family with amidase domain
VSGLCRESLVGEETTVTHLWARLVDTYARKLLQSDEHSYRLQNVWDRVDRTLSRPWTVKDLAALANMSEEHLRRLCRRYHNQSPMRLVTAMRMRRAATLLLTESLKVEAVADEVGYQNAFAFSTAFKRFAGVAPSDYRRCPR